MIKTISPYRMQNLTITKLKVW